MPLTKQHSAYAWVVTCILFLINLAFHNLSLHSSYTIHPPFTDYFLRLPYSELLEKRLFRSRANRRLVARHLRLAIVRMIFFCVYEALSFSRSDVNQEFGCCGCFYIQYYKENHISLGKKTNDPPYPLFIFGAGKIWGASRPDQHIAFGFNELKQNNMFALFEQDHLGTWSTKFKESKPYGWSKTSQLVAVWWLHVFVHLVWPNFDWHV